LKFKFEVTAATVLPSDGNDSSNPIGSGVFITVAVAVAVAADMLKK